MQININNNKRVGEWEGCERLHTLMESIFHQTELYNGQGFNLSAHLRKNFLTTFKHLWALVKIQDGAIGDPGLLLFGGPVFTEPIPIF